MMSSIDQRFMSDLEEGPANIFLVRQPTWRSLELKNLLIKHSQQAADKVAQAAATFEIDDAGPMPAIALRKERQPGLPSDRQPLGDWPIARSGPVNLPRPHLPHNHGEG